MWHIFAGVNSGLIGQLVFRLAVTPQPAVPASSIYQDSAKKSPPAGSFPCPEMRYR